MFVINNLLRLQFILLPVLSQYIVGVLGMNSEELPIIRLTQCTSRTLQLQRSDDVGGGSTIIWPPSNSTDDNEDDGNGLDNQEDEWDNNVFLPYCPDGYFCDATIEKDEDGADILMGLCKACPGSSDRCLSYSSIYSSIFPPEDEYSLVMERAVLEECQEQCGAEKNMCSSTVACPNGLFCNFENDKEISSTANGYCEGCPHHLFLCGTGKNLTSKGFDACESSCTSDCVSQGTLVTITTTSTSSSAFPISIDDVSAVADSPQLSATGPIVDCGLGLEPCEDAEGSVCFIERGKAPFVNKTRNCHAGGGIATVFYNVEAKCENIEATFNGAAVLIPAVTLTHMEGKAILKQAKAMPVGSPLLVTVGVGGHDTLPSHCILGCTKENQCEGTNLTCDFDNGEFGDCLPTVVTQQCNDEASAGGDYIPCTVEGEFCDFSSGKRGLCTPCPETDSACFYSNLNKEGAKECTAVCTDGNTQEKLESEPCKFCPKGSFAIGDIGDGFSSTEKDEVITPCEFCASDKLATTCSSNQDRWEMDYPNRTIRMYGEGVKCWAIAEFYRSVNIEADSDVCESARSFNYICGCSDTPGYAGAHNKPKQAALVWLPRVGAILSILGSTLMIIGVLQDQEKRKKVIGELIISLSCFDIIGSIGYAFTSYPTPKEDYLYGGEGNEASCTAQGFFIQIGTVSLYLNVSIAFYYLLIIQYSWRERKLRKSWIYPMLFVVPILVGATFASAGIPFYDNVILWCNNSSYYWSEIPVAIAIFIASVVMINLCCFVYKSERASRRFRRHSQNDRSSLSRAFFKQSLVYLGALYLTWPPYLALQIMIARGYAFSHYGFILFAGTAVTLQGFWNFIFHTGLKTNEIGTIVRSSYISVKDKIQGRSILRGMSKSSFPASTRATDVAGTTINDGTSGNFKANAAAAANGKETKGDSDRIG